MIDGVDALGFGKAAPGKDFPAIFLLGTIHQLHARYRSDDAGRTWVRIDDDQHQYANADVPLIIGDPRIYGRVYFTTGGRGVIYGDIKNEPVFEQKIIYETESSARQCPRFAPFCCFPPLPRRDNTRTSTSPFTFRSASSEASMIRKA